MASKDGDIYMMGGLINGSMVKGDLWIIDYGPGNLSCYPIATVSEGPGPRVGHASLLVGNAFIIFGGDTKMEDSDPLRRTECASRQSRRLHPSRLDGDSFLRRSAARRAASATFVGIGAESRAVPPGPRPAGRYGHSLNILGSKIYIFGGQVEGCFFNDLIAYDLNALQNPTNQWEFLLHNAEQSDLEMKSVPSARTNHSIISYNNQLCL